MAFRNFISFTEVLKMYTEMIKLETPTGKQRVCIFFLLILCNSKLIRIDGIGFSRA